MLRILKSRLNLKTSEGFLISIIVDNEAGAVAFMKSDRPDLGYHFATLTPLGLEDRLVQFFPEKDREEAKQLILEKCHPCIRSMLIGEPDEF